MTKIKEIYNAINALAPFSSALEYDNPGLLVGSGEPTVRTVLLALDITPEVVEEASQMSAELIVSHHPVIFESMKRLPSRSVPYLLARAGISAICAHTNLDMAEKGVNACLAGRLGLQNIVPMTMHGETPETLMGEIEPTSPAEFAAIVKEALGCDGLRFTDGGRQVRRVGLCGGSGSDFLRAAAERGCEAFVTGESKHHVLLEARERGVTYVDAGHFYTEDVVIEPLRKLLQGQFIQLVFRKSLCLKSPALFL